MNERKDLVVTAGHDLQSANAHWEAIVQKFEPLRGGDVKTIGFREEEVTNRARLNFVGFGRNVLLQLVAKASPTAGLVGEVVCVVSAPNFKPVICERIEVTSSGQTDLVNERGSMMHLSTRGDQSQAILEHLLFKALEMPLEPQD